MGTGTDVQPGEEITASKINLKLEDVDEQDLNATVVATTKIQDGAVTSAKIGGSAVTSAEIGGSAVTTPKIDVGVVTSGKIGGSAVTTPKLDDAVVTSSKIASGGVTQTELATGAARWDEVKGTVLTNVAVVGGGTVEAIDTGLGSGPSQYSVIPQANFNWWEDARPGGGTIHVATDAAAPGGSLVVQAIQ